MFLSDKRILEKNHPRSVNVRNDGRDALQDEAVIYPSGEGKSKLPLWSENETGRKPQMNARRTRIREKMKE
jgi:hypothetical protein